MDQFDFLLDELKHAIFEIGYWKGKKRHEKAAEYAESAEVLQRELRELHRQAVLKVDA